MAAIACFVILLAIELLIFLNTNLTFPWKDQIIFLLGSLYFAMHFGVIYPVWRYVGPASIAIEQLKAEGRLTLSPSERRSASARAWWDTPWAALPAVALFGLVPDIPGIGRLLGFEPLAIPVAVIFAMRHGRAALLPIVLGTVPFWMVTSEIGMRTVGGLWPAVVVLFWAKLAADPEFRARLLQRERLAWLDVVLIVVLLAFLLRVFNVVPFLLDNDLRVDSSSMILTVCVILAVSRVPRSRVMFALGVLLLLSIAQMLLPEAAIRVGNIDLSLAQNATSIVVGMLCFIAADRFRAPPVHVAMSAETKTDIIALSAVGLRKVTQEALLPACVLAYGLISFGGLAAARAGCICHRRIGIFCGRDRPTNEDRPYQRHRPDQDGRRRARRDDHSRHRVVFRAPNLPNRDTEPGHGASIVGCDRPFRVRSLRGVRTFSSARARSHGGRGCHSRVASAHERGGRKGQ